MNEEGDRIALVPRSTAPSLRLLFILTLVAVAVGILAWLDNIRGFRDAGALAELLAAVFGMISVIWLAGAVFLQREELSLQRHELNLQRLEVARLADAAEDQRTTVAAQTELDRKNVTTTNVRNILISLDRSLSEFLKDTLWEFTTLKFPGETANGSYVTAYMKPEGFNAHYKDSAGQARQTGRLSYAELNALLTGKEGLFAFRALVNVAKACEQAGILDWFKNDLVFYMEPIDEVGRPEIYCILNAAAHFAPN